MRLPHLIPASIIASWLACAAQADVCGTTVHEETDSLNSAVEAIGNATYDAATKAVQKIGKAPRAASAPSTPVKTGLSVFHSIANEAFMSSVSSGYGSGKSADISVPKTNKLMNLQNGTFAQPLFD